MDTVTVKTSELIGPALDWAVAECEGRKIEFNYQYTEEIRFDGWWQLGPNHWQPLNSYSTHWAQGGPIIERERIALETRWETRGCGVHTRFKEWCARHPKNHGGLIRYTEYGPTPLIAAMRCYVASKLGDTVKIPKGLMP